MFGFGKSLFSRIVTNPALASTTRSFSAAVPRALISESKYEEPELVIKPLGTYWMLFYQYGPNAAERRKAIRSSHWNFVQRYVQNGKLIIGGSYNEPMDGAAIVFKGTSREEVEEFAENDPYIKTGLVINYQIRDWTVVIHE